MDLKAFTTTTMTDWSEIKKLSSLTQSSLTGELSDKPEDFLKQIKEIKKKYLMNIDNFANNKLINHIENFKYVWGGEIKKIVDLYKVKYDKRDIF